VRTGPTTTEVIRNRRHWLPWQR